MKAIVVAQGGVECKDVDVPSPGPDQVLVDVKAAGLNRADLTVAAGASHGAIGGPGTIVGMEFAGDVVEVGANVTTVGVGERVMCAGGGGYAEMAVADYGRVLPIPGDMSYEVAATLPVALATMHNAVVTRGRLIEGESILIQGASSGVGLMGMQIAKHVGASVVLGSSTHAGRRSQLTRFGADFAIDTSDPQWPKQVLEATNGAGVDLIVDDAMVPRVIEVNGEPSMKLTGSSNFVKS